MKKYILLLPACLLLLMLTSFIAKDQNNGDTQIHSTDDKEETYFYYYKGNKKYLKLNPKYIFVSGTDENSVQRVNLNTDVRMKTPLDVHEDIIKPTLSSPNNFKAKHPVRYWTAIELSERHSKKSYLAQIEALRSNTNLIVAPYFESETGDKIGLSNHFYVKLKKPTDFDMLLEQIEQHQVELVGYKKAMPLWFKLSTSPKSPSALKMANLFYETGLFQHAEPVFILDLSKQNQEEPSSRTFTPDDPFYSSQWYLNNTGQFGGTAGIDINVEDAWDITLGNNITIGVLEGGVSMNHPDLFNNILGTGYNTVTGVNLSILYDPHGTKMAGIAGAENNNDEGISGVAPNCNLVSISYSPSTVTLDDAVDGIIWAYENSVDIIINRWSTTNESALVDDVINTAFTQGRNGLGSIVIFDSGVSNIDGSAYPANSNPSILCVGGIGRCGVRAGRIDIVPESCSPWSTSALPGSGFGSPLDVVAGASGIYTTDWDGGYTWLTGTSAASSQVAGVAALVLSAKPNLTVQQVNNIIEQSAQKIRPDLYTYQNTPGRPNGTWNNELGYGLVDAHQAVLLALADCPSNIIDTDVANLGSNYLVAENLIISTKTIEANKSITYRAGRQIILGKEATSGKGFLADASNGSVFLAEIGDCDLISGSSSTNLSPELTDVIYNYGNAPLEASRQITTNSSPPLTIRNYPNPFTGQTTIVFDLPEDAEVTLLVSDITGKQVALLYDKQSVLKGKHEVVFEGSTYPAGMYYYTIHAGKTVETGKMILAK